MVKEHGDGRWWGCGKWRCSCPGWWRSIKRNSGIYVESIWRVLKCRVFIFTVWSTAIGVFICLFHCLSVRLLIRKHVQISPYCCTVHVTCGRDSVFLWLHCDTLCTSGFVDDVMFSYNAGNRPGRRVCFVKFVRWRHLEGGGEVCRLWLHIVSVWVMGKQWWWNILWWEERNIIHWSHQSTQTVVGVWLITTSDHIGPPWYIMRHLGTCHNNKNTSKEASELCRLPITAPPL